MKRLLIAGIVLICCAVGSSWTTHTSTSDGTMNFDAGTTLEATDSMWIKHSDGTGLMLTASTPECQHPKLKALGDNCWGGISKHEYCPTEYRQRAYKCRECKKKIVVLQAILIEE